MEESKPAGPSTSAPSPPESTEYGDIHKLVLQGLMAAGYLDAKGVKRLFVGVCSYLNINSEEWTKMSFVQKVVREINEKIKPFDMAIRSASCELTGKKFYVYLLTVEKPIMKMQTMFSKFEIDLYQKLMDNILRKYTSFSMPLTECINLALEIDKKANLEASERFILNLVDLSYVTKITFSGQEEEFNVTLGFRGIREFEPILRELYDDCIANCFLCKVILLQGYVCARCKTPVHRPCYTRFAGSVKCCPICSRDWSEETSMLPRAREYPEIDDSDASPSKGDASAEDDFSQSYENEDEEEYDGDKEGNKVVEEEEAKEKQESSVEEEEEGESELPINRLEQMEIEGSPPEEAEVPSKRGGRGRGRGVGRGRGRTLRSRSKLSSSEESSE